MGCRWININSKISIRFRVIGQSNSATAYSQRTGVSKRWRESEKWNIFWRGLYLYFFLSFFWGGIFFCFRFKIRKTFEGMELPFSCNLCKERSLSFVFVMGIGDLRVSLRISLTYIFNFRVRTRATKPIQVLEIPKVRFVMDTGWTLNAGSISPQFDIVGFVSRSTTENKEKS